MMRKQVAIVDYGIGNQTSVQQIIRHLGHRCTITYDHEQILQADLVILPGVGAFPAAMRLLHSRELVAVIQERAARERSILGICLGMQLLTNCSDELGFTQGLGLIPGKIKRLRNPLWHIGWNTLDVIKDTPIVRQSNGQAFFFNHSYIYEELEEYILATVTLGINIPAIISRGRIIGIQFHPEKSQEAGRLLLANVINTLCE